MLPSTQPRSRRSSAKNAAILDAAEALLVAHGYDAVSIEAIAARAAVSTRTVYDHFGSKEGLLRAVVERASAVIMEAVRAALDEALPPGFDPATGLLAFARKISTGTFTSSNYVRFRRIVASAGSASQSVAPVVQVPDELLEARLQEALDRGDLTATSARRATQHFIALTLLLAADLIDTRAETPDSEVDALLTDGVEAFVRAYAPRPPTAPAGTATRTSA